MTIDTAFCGGNLRVLSEDGDTIHLANEIRDTTEDWFYWAFRVRGAQGRTLTFDFSPKGWVGYFGAAVSHDLINWHWSRGTAVGSGSAFTYTFADDEDTVYFAHDMLYHPSRFFGFAEERGLCVRNLCTDRRGTPVPFVTVGRGAKTILLTARHHACEATGDYIMEGIIDAFLSDPIPGVQLIAIPFVDADGVVYGDQGKARYPHDHNRDYGEGLYPTVREIKRILAENRMLAVFDLHSPWHCGGCNDKVFLVHNETNHTAQCAFAPYFAAALTSRAMQYDPKNDIDPGVDWNAVGPHISCSAFGADVPGIALSLSLETTYFGDAGDIISQEKMVETGRCFMRGAHTYFKTHHLL